MDTVRTTCCVAGCGPAGAVLGLLLARAGGNVVVLEKHADFLRDFRGDTIHPSTARHSRSPTIGGSAHWSAAAVAPARER